jgi:small-conductance mechanosensitive channel
METVGIHFPRVLMALVFIVGGVVLGRVASTAIVRTGFRLPPPQLRRLALLTRVAIVVTATLIAATQLGLDVSLVTSFILIAWAAALGAAALAFGLGARETIANILAMHYVTQAFQIGQRVRVGSDEGRIVRTTRTAVYLENDEGELSIPGRDFADSRCVLLSVEGPREP